MARRLGLSGALALLLALAQQAPSASALAQSSWEHDAVALVQRSAAPTREGKVAQLAEQAAAVEQSLKDLMSQRIRSSPLSLLAVNASVGRRTSSGWHEMDDSQLLQKLHDRMKANEEKEQEELANAQAVSENGMPTGAAFLNQAGAKPAGLRKNDATQWLTQADIDHYADDERRLHQLSVEMQRVAAHIATIASHQREIGMHLGLPDPATQKFEAGDRIEIQVGEGAQAGKWVKASIIGPGDRPNTWNVHVPSTKKASKDMPNVPSMALRKDDNPDAKIYEPSEAKYEVGEQAQVQIAIGPLSGQWVKCSIQSLADLPDAYNIYVPSAPAGHRDIPSVPARTLRKAESKGLFKQYDMDGDGLLSSEEFKIAMREKATSVYMEEEGQTGGLYKDGEHAELFAMEGDAAGSWINVTVMGAGALANTWNIFIPDAKPGYQYAQNILSERLRKVGENKTAAEAAGHPIRIIPSQATHEVLMGVGQYKGQWVPCELRRKSDTDESHTIWVPFGAPDGHSVMPNVGAEKLRPRSTCGEGYEDIFDADSPGYDHYERSYNRKDTASDCAADCSKRFSCRSFEWSPSVKECHLNKVSDPSLPANGDYLFCRRMVVPTTKAELWEGPLIGQELEYLVTTGEHNGTWHPCKLAGFGTTPDTYSILASVAYLNSSTKVVNVSGVSASILRYEEGKPLPKLLENWEPPEGEAALFRNATAEEEAAAAQAAAAAKEEGAANATVTEEDLSESGVEEKREEEGERDEEQKEDGEEEMQQSSMPKDFGDDLPDGLFRVNQTVDVKQADTWVRCLVISRDMVSETYNLRLVQEDSDNMQEEQEEMRQVPAKAIRKVPKAERPAVEEPQEPAELQGDAKQPLDASGIDGEIGESVEVLVFHGPRSGQWVPAVIKGLGTEPDSYNINVPSLNGTNQLVRNVRGTALRRTDKKVVVVEEEPEYEPFSEGERALLTIPVGPRSNVSYNCTVKSKGSAKNTYDLEVPSFGTYPAAHARLLSKLSPDTAPVSPAADPDTHLAVSVRTTMKLLQATKADLLPVLTKVLEQRRELRTWLKRLDDWQSGCDHIDRANIATKLQELSALSPEHVAAAVPEECSLAQWTQGGGFDWELFAACFRKSMNTSTGCSTCPTRFLITSADKCTVRCTAMASYCREGIGNHASKCNSATGRCLDCMQGPLEEFLDCTEASSRGQIITSIGQMIKSAKGGGDPQIEDHLRGAVDLNMFLSMDALARQGLRALLFSWGPFMSRNFL